MKNKILAILLLFSLLSCSLGSLLIGKLDYYITRKTSTRLGLYVKQEEQLAKDVEKLLDDLKPEVGIIVENVKLIRNNSHQLAGVITDKKIKEFNANYIIIVKKVFSVLGIYLADLSDKQKELFLESLESQIKKRKKKTDQRKQHEKFMTQINEFIGELNPEQKFMIKKIKQELYDYSWLRIKQQENQYNALVKAYTLPENEKLKAMQELFNLSALNIEQILQSESFHKISETIINILNTLTKKQQEHLRDKCDFFIDLLESFIKNKYST